jgi:hypothetical protein
MYASFFPLNILWKLHIGTWIGWWDICLKLQYIHTAIGHLDYNKLRMQYITNKDKKRETCRFIRWNVKTTSTFPFK